MKGRSIGVLTRDFRLYHDLVAGLRTRGLSFIVLSPGEAIPPEVGVIITSPGEVARIRFPHKVAAATAEEALGAAVRLLRGKESFQELIIGIDPGPRPGLAVVGDGEVVEVSTAESPEAVAPLVESVVRSNRAAEVKVRVGNGDPTNRNRIINALAQQRLPVEIADEKGTTRDTRRDDTRNIEAAVGIAFTPGIRAERWYPLEPTEGEIREIQRVSRIDSAGEVTISRELASRVAKGKLTMAEAVRRQKEKRGRKKGSGH
jgi:hypothetical protein